MARSGGRIPKRSSERRRRNVTPGLTAVTRAGSVDVPDAPDGLHPVALRWYEALGESGQSEYFEPSDWVAAAFVATAMSVQLTEGFTASGFAAVWGAMQDMLTTEGARRRARIEVERAIADGSVGPGVTALDEYRKALAK